MKLGDKILCKKSYYGEYGAIKKLFKKPVFRKNKRYKIDFIYLSPPYSGEFSNIDDFICYFEVNSCDYKASLISEYFYSNREERSLERNLKLKKIKQTYDY